MRLPLIPPQQLSPAQKALYDDMQKGMKSNFNAFRNLAEDGSLIGPWNAWLHEPVIGGAICVLAIGQLASFWPAFRAASIPPALAARAR